MSAAAGAGAGAAAVSKATPLDAHGLTPDWQWMYDYPQLNAQHIAYVAAAVAAARAVPPPPKGTMAAALDVGKDYRVRAGGRSELIIPPAHPHVKLLSLRRVLKEWRDTVARPTGDSSSAAVDRSVHVALHPTDPTEWRVWMCGGQGSLFDGAVVQFDVAFSDRYPFRAFRMRLIRTCPGERAPAPPTGERSRVDGCRTGYAYEMGFGLCCYDRESQWSPALTCVKLCALMASSTAAKPAPPVGARGAAGSASSGLHIWESTHMCVCDLPALVTRESAPAARAWVEALKHDPYFETDYSELVLDSARRTRHIVALLCGTDALRAAAAKYTAPNDHHIRIALGLPPPPPSTPSTPSTSASATTGAANTPQSSSTAAAAVAAANAAATTTAGPAAAAPVVATAVTDSGDDELVGGSGVAGLPVDLARVVLRYAERVNAWGDLRLGDLKLRAGVRAPPSFPTELR